MKSICFSELFDFVFRYIPKECYVNNKADQFLWFVFALLHYLIFYFCQKMLVKATAALAPITVLESYSGAQNHMYIDREHCVSRSRLRSVICSHFARTVIEICSNFAREMIASIFDREHLCEQPLNFKQFRRM